MSDIQNFIIESNRFLKKDTTTYYHYKYTRYREPNNPDFLVTLKNTYNSSDYKTIQNLEEAMLEVKDCVGEFLTFIANNHYGQIPVCVVPRSLVQTNDNKMQFCFKQAIKEIIKGFNDHNRTNKFIDATNCIMRHTKTKTTHLKNTDDTGAMPYVGITKDTCNICNGIRDKFILLIDDIYTKTINIDEDCIQALYDKGARKIIFYAVARTMNEKYDF
ncbi:MAG: hypothetical protein SPF34_02130 [Helicobacter sp.]|uniref:hypothetical protein n=1 Tax=Helicobacter sp. TaxID=218 RepID=UPI002A909A58|nr:hypothetical protein [Helicobacter sp.]MDY5615692.1 hypothetical protein [Helicobacter sp.]